jgi:hypothetical protein
MARQFRIFASGIFLFFINACDTPAANNIQSTNASEISSTGSVEPEKNMDMDPADDMQEDQDIEPGDPMPNDANQPTASDAPVTNVANEVSGPKQLRMVQGRFFAYALPEDWRTTEDGQFAVVSVAPDNQAISIMVGNAGMPLNYPAGQYIYNNLSRSGFQQVSMGQQGRPAKPISGCSQAFTFDFRYSVNGIPCIGVATCHIAPSYDLSTMIMTAAASVESQWNGYRTWLPEIPALMQALSGEAFGARGIMQQNIRNSTAYAEAARNYRTWSEKNWKEVTDDRNRSVDERNTQFRENLGAVQTYVNPYNPQRPLELSTQYKYYWIDPQGKTMGTNDPSENPNQGSTVEWKRLQKKSGGQKN